MAAGLQQGLQFAVFGAGQAGIVGGPGGDEADVSAVAVDQGGELGDRQRVVFAGVVAVDSVEVLAGEERRASLAAGQQQAGIRQVLWPRPALGPPTRSEER